MRRGSLVAWSVTFAVAVTPQPAGAQSPNRFAVGANITSAIATAPQAESRTHIGLQWRLGHGGDGWGWKYGFNWYSMRIDGLIGGRVAEMGELHVRPVMAGYGYTRVVHNTSITATVFGGYAFNGFSLDEGASALYQATDGSRNVSSGAKNTFVLYPEISAWHDVSRKVGIRASVGYMRARPEISVETQSGIERRAVSADMLQVKIGAVYSLF